MTAWDPKPWPGSSSTYRLTLLAKPTAQPISFEQACGHLRLGDPLGAEAVAQEEIIAGLIKAAVGEVQRYCDIAVLTQKWRLTSDSISLPYGLPKAPLQSVDKITDADGNVIDPAGYVVELDERLPGLIRSSSTGVGGSWGAVEFTAGWKTPDDVPQELIQAMLLMVGTWFMHRESAQPFSLEVIPSVTGVQQMLDPFRIEVIA